MSRQTIGSSAVIGVPDGDNPVQPIRPSRIGGKGRLIAEYADLIGAENLFAEYQCGLAAARGPRVLVLGVDPAAIRRPVPAPGTGATACAPATSGWWAAGDIAPDNGARPSRNPRENFFLSVNYLTPLNGFLRDPA